MAYEKYPNFAQYDLYEKCKVACSRNTHGSIHISWDARHFTNDSKRLASGGQDKFSVSIKKYVVRPGSMRELLFM